MPLSKEQVENAYNRIAPEKTNPSGTSCFKIDFGGYEITMIKNDLMQEGFALVSPDIYEKLHHYFTNLSNNTTHAINQRGDK